MGKDIALENLRGFASRGARSSITSCIPTGHAALDYALMHGPVEVSAESDQFEKFDPKKPDGIPLGKMCEFYGEPGGGKSSLAYRVVGYAQRMGLDCLWIDAEQSFSESLAEINGVDLDTLILSKLINTEDPDKIYYAEDILDQMISACKGNVKVIVLDSVANLITKYRLEHGAEQKTMGQLALILSENLPKLAAYAARHGVLIIFINQIREKPGVMFGDPETTKGGNSLKHNCSIRLKITRMQSKEADIKMENDDGSETLIAGQSYVMLKKNRFAKPVRGSIAIPIYYERYFPDMEEILFNTGRQLKVISVRKGVFTWDEVKTEGKVKFVEQLGQANP
jgi:recombination protein RecA